MADMQMVCNVVCWSRLTPAQRSPRLVVIPTLLLLVGYDASSRYALGHVIYYYYWSTAAAGAERHHTCNTGWLARFLARLALTMFGFPRGGQRGSHTLADLIPRCEGSTFYMTGTSHHWWIIHMILRACVCLAVSQTGRVGHEKDGVSGVKTGRPDGVLLHH